jgi:hypothetical protein
MYGSGGRPILVMRRNLAASFAGASDLERRLSCDVTGLPALLLPVPLAPPGTHEGGDSENRDIKKSRSRASGATSVGAPDRRGSPACTDEQLGGSTPSRDWLEETRPSGDEHRLSSSSGLRKPARTWLPRNGQATNTAREILSLRSTLPTEDHHRPCRQQASAPAAASPRNHLAWDVDPRDCLCQGKFRKFFLASEPQTRSCASIGRCDDTQRHTLTAARITLNFSLMPTPCPSFVMWHNSCLTILHSSPGTVNDENPLHALLCVANTNFRKTGLSTRHSMPVQLGRPAKT